MHIRREYFLDIIVIGNGFDLAHGLPTKYIDFLKWVEVIDKFLKPNFKLDKDFNEWERIDNQIKNLIIKHYKDKLFEDEYKKMRNDNIWIIYFLFIYEELMKQDKKNWIDFESEISYVVQYIESYPNEDIDENFIYKFSNEFYNFLLFNQSSSLKLKHKKFSKKKVRDVLYNDLNRLTRLLEIYFLEYVEKMEINVMAPEIKSLCYEFHNSEEYGPSIKFNNIITFNYTHTFEMVYYNDFSCTSRPNESFIHGEVDISNNIDTNNMVLGIDEYLTGSDKDNNIDFIGFKKYFQRIYKGTDIKYKEWIKEINKDDMIYQRDLSDINSEFLNDKKNNEKYILRELGKLKNERFKHKVYFYGHSLDITDKDIIRELILHDTVLTTIYYYAGYKNDKSGLFSKIANLVKIIGQDELIKRINEKSIVFIKQQDMIPIKP